MKMGEKKEKPKLTAEQRAEKRRLKALYLRLRPAWESTHPGVKLTQAKLGEMVGEILGREPLSQGVIWQYMSETHDTKLNADFVQCVAAILEFDPAQVGTDYALKPHQATLASAVEPDGIMFSRVGAPDHRPDRADALEALKSATMELDEDERLDLLAFIASLIKR